METALTVFLGVGAFAFGLVVGWTTYFILRRANPTALSDLATLIGILGGATILGLFDPKGPLFAGYAIGLAFGFFGYFLIYKNIVGITAIREALKKEKDGGGAILE